MGITSNTFDRWLSRGSGLYGLWPIVPAGASLGMAWLSSTVGWINQFGAFGWASTGILTFFLVSAALALIGVWREKWVASWATKNWNLRTDTINPLQSTFESQRIKISEISHPVKNNIENKSFNHCELFGPDVIILVGCTLNGVGFVNCDTVVVKDGATVKNVKVIENCNFFGGTIWNCVILAPRLQFEQLQKALPGIEAITSEFPDGSP